MFWKRKVTDPDEPQAPVKRCSFCNKSARDVPKLVAGPGVNICSECVAICQEILDENRILDSGKSPEQLSVDRERAASGAAMLCGLCGNLIDVDGLVDVPSRGKVCLPCVESVAAIRPEVVR